MHVIVRGHISQSVSQCAIVIDRRRGAKKEINAKSEAELSSGPHLILLRGLRLNKNCLFHKKIICLP